MSNDSADRTTTATMLGGASAGLFGRLICHPIDTCKTRLQAQFGSSHNYRSIKDVVKRTIKEEGIIGFYRGLGAVTVLGTPAACMYFTGYEESKNYLSQHGVVGKSTFFVHLLSGLFAEAYCGLLFVPVDVIKERMQVQRRCAGGSYIAYPGLPVYKNSFQALYSTVRSEGLFGIYRGYGATLLSFGPFSALYFMFYEELKVTNAKIFRGDPEKPSFISSLLCSAVAGSLASFLTSPLDMAKLRLQRSTANMSEPSPETKYKNFVDALIKIYRLDGGTRALFRGSFARVLFHVPNTAITMSLFEMNKAWWLQTLHVHDA